MGITVSGSAELIQSADDVVRSKNVPEAEVLGAGETDD